MIGLLLAVFGLTKMAAGLSPDFLASLKAREVVELLRSGKTTTAELLGVMKARHASVDPFVAATPLPNFDVDVNEQSSTRSPLFGLPVLVKASQPVAGLPQTDGWRLGRLAAESSATVRKLEAGGGVVAGLTNIPEFEAGSQCFNTLFPTTSTPYDTRRTSGGSSGGSAAAVASLQGWLATGGDLGGSLRVPAAFCGVVGFRTSPGVVRKDEPIGPLNSIDGPVSRDVVDCGLFLDCLAPREEFSWRDVAERAAASRPTYRVAFSTLQCPVRREVETIAEAAATKLGGGNATRVVEPWGPLDLTRRLFQQLRAKKFQEKFGAFSPEDFADLKPEIQWNAKQYEAKSNETPVATDALDAGIAALFDSFDILATPATLDLPFDKNVRYPVSNYGAIEEDLPDYLEWIAITYLVSATNCPAIVIPCGKMNDDGLPVGIQLVAKQGNDAMLLEAAASLEATLGLDFHRGLSEPRTGTGTCFSGCGPTTVDEARRQPHCTQSCSSSS